MTAWVFFWKVVLTLAIAFYFGVAVVVSILGGFDLWRLFRHLEQEEDAPKATLS